MLTITNITVTRAEVWRAFRRVHDVRLRERYHGILLLMAGKNVSRDCPMVVSGRGDHSQLGACLQYRRAPRPGTRADSRAARLTHGSSTGPGQRGGPPLPAGVGVSHELVNHEGGPALHLHPLWPRALSGGCTASAPYIGVSPAPIAPPPPEGQARGAGGLSGRVARATGHVA
jgi:hypothetical protein